MPLSSNDGRVDTVALRRLIARLGAAQVDSVGLLASTGTYMYLSREERRRALAETLDEIAGRMPVVVGVGALRTDEAVRLAQDAKALGAAAGLAMSSRNARLSAAERCGAPCRNLVRRDPTAELRRRHP
jgi:4-hydroxy-tetrahydrodipicolinate synthase